MLEVFRGPPCWTGTKEGRNKKVEERSLPGESSGRGVLWGGAPSLVRDTTCCSSASARLAHSDAAALLTPPPSHRGLQRFTQLPGLQPTGWAAHPAPPIHFTTPIGSPQSRFKEQEWSDSQLPLSEPPEGSARSE